MYMSISERIERLAAENAVSMSSCCMRHSVKRFLCELGVNPMVYELDEDPTAGKDMEKALKRMLCGSASAVPAVFIGGKLVRSMDKVLCFHINGSLVPLLKDAGALWL